MNGTLLGFTMSNDASEDDARNTSSGLCLNQYSGMHCLRALQSIAACESPGSENENVYISHSVVDQDSAEEAIGKVIFALTILSNQVLSVEVQLFHFSVCTYLEHVEKIVMTIDPQRLSA